MPPMYSRWILHGGRGLGTSALLGKIPQFYGSRLSTQGVSVGPNWRKKTRMEGQQRTLRSATGWDVLLWLGRRRRRWRVTGESMVPLLQPGEEVLMNPHAYRDGNPRPGEIVVARHPQRSDCFPLIKRVRVVESDGRCHLEGDNGAASTDSRQFGLVMPQDILGQVVCRFP